MALQDVRDRIHLHLARVLKATLSDCPLELVLKEQLVPAHKIGAELVVGSFLIRLDVLGAVILVIRDVHL